VNIPSPPLHFLENGKPMDFNLTNAEKMFLRKQLIGVLRGTSPQTSQSLLARIAESRLALEKITTPWANPILKIADREDKMALSIAKQSAALAGIGRAVYAALVEDAKVADGGQRTTRHRDDVKKLVAEQGVDASELDLSALNALVPDLPSYLRDVLAETQKWVVSGRQRVDNLRDVYQKAEDNRKGSRARLADNMGGRGRRAVWSAQDHSLAEPLHFRWGNVRRLLNDIVTQ